MSEANIVGACGSLIDFHAWDPSKIDPKGWLRNFSDKDRPVAAALLGRFTFYADHLVDQLFRSAFQSLSNTLEGDWKDFADAQLEWQTFCQSAIITLVQGEDPNPADSGWLFARKARQILGVAEPQLANPADAVASVMKGHEGPVIFVDDFVGSGDQFIATWERVIATPSHGNASFKQAAALNPKSRFYYCNAMTTVRGRNRIASAAPDVYIAAGNLIPPDHSLSSIDSALWRDTSVRDAAIELVKRISLSLGFDANGGINDWEGYHKLGLGLAFAHSVPDATLPIFHTSRNGWTPLVRRS